MSYEDDAIMVFDTNSIESIRGLSMRDISIIPHIHNAEGGCLKNRYGASCKTKEIGEKYV